jgi:hypothetical protein
LTQELAAGQLGPDHPEWSEVQQIAAHLSAAISEHTGRVA